MIYAAKLETLHQKFAPPFAHILRLKLNEPERLFASRQLRSIFAFRRLEIGSKSSSTFTSRGRRLWAVVAEIRPQGRNLSIICVVRNRAGSQMPPESLPVRVTVEMPLTNPLA